MLFCGSFSSLYAQDKQDFPTIARVATVNAVAAETSSKIWQSYVEQAEKLKADFQALERTLLQPLQQEGRQIEKQKSTLSEAEFIKLRDEFNMRARKAQQEMLAGKNRLEEKLNEARVVIRKLVQQAMFNLTQRFDLGLLLRQGDNIVLFTKPEYDLTQELTSEIDGLANHIDMESLQFSLIEE